MSWLNRLFNRNRATHQIDLDGLRGFICSNTDSGKKVTVSGWNNEHWKYSEGDLAQLITKRTAAGCYGGTYRIDRVKHCGDPPDMYFIDCTYVGAQPLSENDGRA